MIIREFPKENLSDQNDHDGKTQTRARENSTDPSPQNMFECLWKALQMYEYICLFTHII